MRTRARVALAIILVATAVGGGLVTVRASESGRRMYVTAYFQDTNGLYPGDQVRILGVPVGGIDSITPGPQHSTVRFWYDKRFTVPADATAAILSPALVSARVIQLTPPYTGGPAMADDAVIPEDRTAVPVEWDDLRQQLQKLTDSLQPVEPGGVSPLGQLINSGADNLRGRGAEIRDAIIKLSQAVSVLGDHSSDIFSTVKHLSLLVGALQSSRDVLAELNRNLAAVSGAVADDPQDIGAAVDSLNLAVADIRNFIADNRDTLGTTADKLTSISTAVVESTPDVKQTLHVAPNSIANLTNIYYPATGAGTGQLALTNFANPLQFICGSIQAASRLNYEQSAKLCVQYLAPILKNRQYNFPPVGTTAGLAQIPVPIPVPLPIPPFLSLLLAPIPVAVVGAKARPNEVTYSEDWMRPDYVPAPSAPGAQEGPPLAAEAQPSAPPSGSSGAPLPVDPAAGLPGLMLPPGS